MELKVALCQFDMVWEDTAANLRTAGRMVAEADADLVICPRCSLRDSRPIPVGSRNRCRVKSCRR